MRPVVALVFAVGAAAATEQVRIGLGVLKSQLNVEWVTQKSSQGYFPRVEYGLSAGDLGSGAAGDERAFKIDTGIAPWYTHVAVLDGLEVNTKYYYRVGDDLNGWSETFSVWNRRWHPEGEPETHILLGDLGTSCAFTLCLACSQHSYRCDKQTCAGNSTAAGLVSETDADLFLHVGDFAYDLSYFNGTVGAQFFKNIEQIAARTPYMVSHGNHEDSGPDLAHYIESFRYMPSTSTPNTFTTINGGGALNSMYYSFDQGLVHYVAISTELWFGVSDGKVTNETQIQWLVNDLEEANKNRDRVPWIVVHGHRSIYCSSDSDCDADAMIVRATMEPILFKYGVDLFVNGHEHNYERMWPTYLNNSDQSNIDPKATIYIVTGAAGNQEMHEPFTREQPSWSAFRSNSFSYTRMLVYNATHIHWQQIQTDPTLFPGSEYGRVIDDTWFVQHRHGPFDEATAPKMRPTTCDTCSSHDHWGPLLGIDDHSGRPLHQQIASWRKQHGDDAWRDKLDALMANLKLKHGPGPDSGVKWEDVRPDGNSDGAWAYPRTFKWRKDDA